MPWTHIAALIACIIGGGLGAYAMVNPAWASKLVRLVAQEGKIEGRSEFRATYGGLFFLGHAFVFWAVATAQPDAEMAAAAVGAGWAGSSIGRITSIALDKTGSGLNWFNVAFEAALGLTLLSSLLFR